LARVYKEVDQKFKNVSPTPTLKESYEKSIDEQTKPIRDSLYLALDAFAKERNIKIIFNTAGRLHPGIASFPSIDVTKSFIEKYNKDNP
jgi:hypothetical protein